MVSGPRVVLLLGLCLLSVTAVGSAVAATDQRPVPQTAQADADITQRIVVELQHDGDARWTITKTFNLTSRNETAAFEDLAQSFERGRTDALGLPAYRRAAQLASDSTGRAMTITNVTREASRSGTATNGTGRLSVSFTWAAFGRVDGQRLHVDDVFTTEQGQWFQGLTEHQRLVVVPPDGYEFFDAPTPVTLRNGTIQWTGPQDFGPDTLSATFMRTGDSSGPSGDDAGLFLWLGLVALGGAVAVVGYFLTTDRNLPDVSPSGEGATTGSTDGGAATAPASGTQTDEATADTEVTDAGTDGADAGDDTIDEELLSDEERVERLLDRNGGRMKQADIVKETGWSNAKVSQLLSAMEEEGRIDKLRIGRENLISYPEEDVADLEE